MVIFLQQEVRQEWLFQSLRQNFHLEKDEFTIIPVDCVMFLQLSSDDRRLSAEEKSSSIVTSCYLLTDNEIDSLSERIIYQVSEKLNGQIRQE